MEDLEIEKGGIVSNNSGALLASVTHIQTSTLRAELNHIVICVGNAERKTDLLNSGLLAKIITGKTHSQPWPDS